MTFADVLCAAIIKYHTTSLPKYPTWAHLSDREQRKVVVDEVQEWLDAGIRGDVEGEHGEIAELIDVIVVAARRVMELTRGR